MQRGRVTAWWQNNPSPTLRARGETGILLKPAAIMHPWRVHQTFRGWWLDGDSWLLSKVLPDVVGEAENVSSVSKCPIYAGCSPFLNQEHAWRQQQWKDVADGLSNVHQMQNLPEASIGKLPVQWSCSPRTGIGAAGFQGAASGAEIYTVLDKKSISTAPVCSWCVVWRQPLLICLFSSPTRFSLALESSAQGCGE